ncbi:MAG TPA: formate--tetrahydrofolate ligase [Syntrophomonas sp.]|jgi:formate--tetrahydrofolate ligase|nr:formate--tetrahydrofolate ligase [Syntrophomonas sp.]
MKTDVQIAQEASLLPIQEIAAQAGIKADELEPYGHYKAKISLKLLDRLQDEKDGKLVLVTAITPTPAGEGKTTVTIGLGQALNRAGQNALIALREPSLGPCFGLKGGATGGGYSQVVPMEDINLHFTGDIHAVTTAHNLLADLLDNSYYFNNPLKIDPNRIEWPRVMDLNDRFLRNIVVGMGGKAHGIPLQSRFDISVASEVMASLCLAHDLTDLRKRFERIIVAYNEAGDPVTAAEVQAVGAMTVLMKDAIKPNLVQTLENTPALIHGGPFANIAHGCSSVIATRMGLKLADYLVTEAGFGADLGAEKFMDLKCRTMGRGPDAVVLVASIRALKMHGGMPKNQLGQEDTTALERGLANLQKHVENMRLYNVPLVVAINQFPTDTAAEIDLLLKRCAEFGAEVALSTIWADGGAGGMELAAKVMEACNKTSNFAPLYKNDLPLKEKINTIATKIYGADGVSYTKIAEDTLERFNRMGYGELPVCVAKTQYSLSDDPALLGRPQGFTVTVRDVRLSAGAGFIVPLMGNILTMPGLPKKPAAYEIDIDPNGIISGLF